MIGIAVAVGYVFVLRKSIVFNGTKNRIPNHPEQRLFLCPSWFRKIMLVIPVIFVIVRA